MNWTGPILDDHLHLDGTDGRGLEAVTDFHNAGGTHLLVVNRPSWDYGVSVSEPADFRVGFDATIEIVTAADAMLDGGAWAILGVHPALISQLVDERSYTVEEAVILMRGGIEEAATYVERDEALGLKTGRPHYPVSEDIWDGSNQVIKHALDRAADLDCPVQLHTESGEDFTDIATWARDVGLNEERVVKHFAEGPIRGPTPSVIARPDPLRAIAQEGVPFLMETDYLDDPDRPGAVLGPKTVPRRVRELANEGLQSALEIAHIETPARVYEIDTRDW